MKIAITGKGGVGKTTLAALLAMSLAGRGRSVLAVDADPDANLASTLDFPNPDAIVPIVEMKQLIAERMGTAPDAVGSFFKLNPKVDDLPETYCVHHRGLRLIAMGMVKRGGGGCACPANTFLKALLDHILLGPDEDIVVDMEAGLEHLGRGTAQAVDGLIIVVEPGLRSLDTLKRIRRLAGDLRLSRCWAVADKVRSPEDRDFLLAQNTGIDFVGWLPYSEPIARAGRGQASLWDVEAEVAQQIDGILNAIQAAPQSAER